MRSIIAAVVAVAALVCCAAPASAGTWGLGMQVHNQSDYELRYVTTQAKNVDRWIQAPDIPASAATIAPHTSSVFIRYQQNTPFGDTWARVIWDVYRPGGGPKLGTVSYVVRVICNVGCAFDYSRSTEGSASPSGLVGLKWKDNGRTPGAGYYGELTVTKPGSQVGSGRATWRMGLEAVNDSPYELRYVTTQANNVDTWLQAPDIPASAATIAPFGRSVPIRWQTTADRKGTWARVIWDAYRDGVKRGQVTFAVRAECGGPSCGYLEPVFSDGTTTLPDIDLAWHATGYPEWDSGYVGSLQIRSKRTSGLPMGAAPSKPLRALTCGAPASAGGLVVETVGVPCTTARRAVAAGTATGGRFATRGWQCTTRAARVTCARGERSFRFRRQAVAAAAGSRTFDMGLVVHNQTRYELRYVTTHAKNIDWWPQAPDVPASVGIVKPFSDSPSIRYISQSGGEDSWARVIYDAYEGGVKRGQVTYAVRVECSGGPAWDYGRSCWDMRRFTDGTTTLGDVALRWQDNGASPYNGYYGEMWATPKSAALPGAPFSPSPLYAYSCAADPRGANVAIESFAVGCKAARRAVARGRFRDGRFATGSWDCETRRRGGELRVTCAIGERSFRFARKAARRAA